MTAGRIHFPGASAHETLALASALDHLPDIVEVVYLPVRGIRHILGWRRTGARPWGTPRFACPSIPAPGAPWPGLRLVLVFKDIDGGWRQFPVDLDGPLRYTDVVLVTTVLSGMRPCLDPGTPGLIVPGAPRDHPFQDLVGLQVPPHAADERPAAPVLDAAREVIWLSHADAGQ